MHHHAVIVVMANAQKKALFGASDGKEGNGNRDLPKLSPPTVILVQSAS